MTKGSGVHRNRIGHLFIRADRVAVGGEDFHALFRKMDASDTRPSVQFSGVRRI